MFLNRTNFGFILSVEKLYGKCFKMTLYNVGSHMNVKGHKLFGISNLLTKIEIQLKYL